MKKFFLVLLYLLPSLIWSQVSIVGTATTALTTSVTTFTYALPGGAGSQRLLILFISAEFNNTSNDINTVTYGGVNMTLIGKTSVSGAGKLNLVAAYRLNESQIITASNNSFVISPSISYTGTANAESMIAATYLLGNVNQANPTEDLQSNTSGNASSISTGNINGETNDLMMYLTTSSGAATTWAAGGSFTESMDIQGGNHSFQIATQLRANNGVSSPAATNSSSNRLAIIAFEVNVGTAPLPVTLVSFNADKDAGGILISWKSLSEKNNAYYSVEHSLDGVSWEEIRRVEGAGTTNLPREYEILHSDPSFGVNYYRLKQTDFDQTFEYFKIIAVNNNPGSSNDYYLFPNPAGDYIKIKNKSISSIEILNSEMKAVLFYTLDPSGSEHTISLKNVPAGNYFVLLRNTNNEVKSIKLIKNL